MVDLKIYLEAGLIGFATLSVVTHPRSFIWKRLTNKQFKLKKIQVFPSIRILRKDKIIHFHHWVNFSILLLISALTSNRFLDNNFTQGFLIGGVLQGLSLRGIHLKIIYPLSKYKDSYHNTF